MNLKIKPKTFTYVSLISATFYFSLFFSIPLTGFFLSYIVFLYFLLEVIVSLYHLHKENDINNKTVVTLSEQEVNAISDIKQKNIDLSQVIAFGSKLLDAKLDQGDYIIFYIPTDEQELVDKIKSVINNHKGT